MARPKIAPETQPVMVRMTPEMLARIDEVRKTIDGIPTRPEIIRIAVDAWLGAQEAERKSNS